MPRAERLRQPPVEGCTDQGAQGDRSDHEYHGDDAVQSGDTVTHHPGDTQQAERTGNQQPEARQECHRSGRAFEPKLDQVAQRSGDQSAKKTADFTANQDGRDPLRAKGEK